MSTPPNIVVIISDTLRTAELGCYGNQDIHTPSIDALARRSTRFTRAYPESLPTIPVRRALHTGRRAYPFRNYRPVKWDIVYLPGWQAMDNDEDTLAENLAAAGYHTGFVTDTLPYFAPGFNFTRGFWQWEYIRGQQQDRWKSPFTVPRERLAQYGNHPDEMTRQIYSIVPMHLANTADVRSEEQTSTAHTFQWAMQFLEDNQKGQPFYLMIDCFDPHEPWEAPEQYYRMYGDPNYRGRQLIFSIYGPAEEQGYSQEEIAFLKSHYQGLVTLVDTWFGKFMAKLDGLGLSDNTAIFLISDHGTNFCDNPRNIIGKPENSMYPGVMRLPFLAQVPDGTGTETICDELVYNVDLTATVYALSGIESENSIHGQSLLPFLNKTGKWQKREYITCRYGHSVCCIDEQTWALGDVNGTPQEIFNLQTDPQCQTNILRSGGQHRWEQAWERLLHDAGGNFSDYREMKRTDAIGHQPVKK